MWIACVLVLHSVFHGSGVFFPQLSQKWLVEDKKLLKVTESVDYDVEGGLHASVCWNTHRLSALCSEHVRTSNFHVILQYLEHALLKAICRLHRLQMI